MIWGWSGMRVTSGIHLTFWRRRNFVGLAINSTSSSDKLQSNWGQHHLGISIPFQCPFLGFRFVTQHQQTWRSSWEPKDPNQLFQHPNWHIYHDLGLNPHTTSQIDSKQSEVSSRFYHSNLLKTFNFPFMTQTDNLTPQAKPNPPLDEQKLFLLSQQLSPPRKRTKEWLLMLLSLLAMI